MRRRKRFLTAVGLLTAVGGWLLLKGTWAGGPASEGLGFTSQAAEEGPAVQAEAPPAPQVTEEKPAVRAPEDPPALPAEEENPALPEEQTEKPVFAPAGDGYFSDALPMENPAAMWIIAGDYSAELGQALSDHACP